MAIIAMIPARYASSRFPGKALARLNGRPMIQHVYERVRRCSIVERTVVATDDDRIVKAIDAVGGEAVITRSDHASGTDRLAEAAQRVGLHDDDIVVNVQGDEPLVTEEMIEELVRAFRREPVCAMGTLAVKSRNEKDYLDPNVVKVVVDQEAKALYFSRSPIPHERDHEGGLPGFLKHLGFYAYSKAFLLRFAKLPCGLLENLEKLEQLRALEHGYSIRVGLSPVDTHGVDTPEDLAKVERRLASLD